MMLWLSSLTLFLTLDAITGTEPTCNTIWRCQQGVYKQGPTYAGSSPHISDEQSCMATCSRAYVSCTGFEYRKGNCWIHTTRITADSLERYNGTVQFYLDQRCHPEFCSPMWLEVGTAYPAGRGLSGYDRGHRNKCLNLCVTSDLGTSNPCSRVFYYPTSGGDYEPYGSKCTLEGEGVDPAPDNCIEYRLINKCL